MKQIISAFLSVMLAVGLTACGTTAEPAPSPSEPPQNTTPLTVEPSESPSVQPEPSETVEPVINRNPLTGLECETDLSRARPVAVMLNTLKKALPQSGNSKADILLEMCEEGGITRIVGIYSDIGSVGTLGTVRSTREYYMYLMMGWDAIVVHAGGSQFAYEVIRDYSCDTINYLNGAEELFWRDEARKKNVGLEHSLYTSGEQLADYIQSSGMRTEHPEGYEAPFVFADVETFQMPGEAECASQIDVSFSGYKSTSFQYDEGTETYLVSCFDAPYVDEANDGTQVSVTNVLVVQTDQHTKSDGEHQEYDLSQGQGWYATEGTYIPISWSKGEPEEPLRFYTAEGNPLQLHPGISYICVCDVDRDVSFS